MIKGTVTSVYGNDINTDDIIPAVRRDYHALQSSNQTH